MASQVFLSYCTRDSAAADMLRRDIEEWGHVCFCDNEAIEPGEVWEAKIFDALRHSFAVVVFATPDAMDSKWVFSEIQIARYMGTPVLFVLTDENTKIPPHLQSIQFINAARHGGAKVFAAELRQALARYQASVPAAVQDRHIVCSEPRPSETPVSSRASFLPPLSSRERERESRQLARRIIELLEPYRRQSAGDAERGLLLAMAAVEEYAWTPEVEHALLTGLLVSKLVGRLPHDQAGIVGTHAANSRVVNVGGGTAAVWQLPECHRLCSIAGRITVARLTKDGSLLVTGDQTGDIKRWSVASGEVEAKLGFHEAPVVQLQLFPCGSVFSLSEDGQGAFYQANGETGAILDQILEEIRPAMGTNGILALARYDGRISLHGADGSLLRSLPGHRKPVAALAFDDTGARLASGAEDGTVSLWNAASGDILMEFEGQSSAITQVSLSPDGRTLATTSGDHVVRLWNADGSLICSLPTGWNPFTRAWLIADDRVATASEDHVVRLWTTQGALLQQFAGHSGSVHAVMLCANRERLLSASSDGNALLWSLAPGSERVCLQHQGYAVERCAFVATGSLVTASWDGVLRIWTHEGQERQRIRAHTKGIISLVVAEDSRLLTVARGEAAQLWELGKKTAVARFGQGQSVRTATMTRRGDRVAWASQEGTVSVAPASDPRSAKVLGGHNDAVVSLAFSSDGRRLLSASMDGSVCLWDTESGTRQLQLRAGGGYAVAQACFDPKNQRVLAISNENAPARIWDAHAGVELFALRDHEEELTDAAFSPCGRWIATASRDKTIRLWDAETGKAHAVLRGHEHAPLRIRFCPDGQRLASVSQDGHALVWGAEAGALLCRLSGHTSGLTDVEFSPDGQEVMTASYDGTARVFAVPRREALLALAKNRVFRELTDEERLEHGLVPRTPRPSSRQPLPSPLY